jgi:hypothetical protein
MSYLGKETSSLERLAEPELQGELIPDRYSGYQKTIYRDGFHAGYKHGLTCARAALAAEPEPVGPTDEELRQVLFDCGYHPGNNYLTTLARAVLARWGQ